MEITIMKLRGNSNPDARGYYDLLEKHEYTEDVGFGFKDLNIEENNRVSGVAVKRTPIFVNVFDENTQSFTEIEQFIISEIDFALDLNTNLIEIYAPVKDVKKVLITFTNTLSQYLTLEQISFNPSRILEFLKDETDSCEITKLHIKDFSSEKGVIGSYDIRSVDTELAWNLVDEYKNQIVKATVEVFENGVKGTLQIFQNGKFKITTKPKNNTDSILNPVKYLIAGKLQ